MELIEESEDSYKIVITTDGEGEYLMVPDVIGEMTLNDIIKLIENEWGLKEFGLTLNERKLLMTFFEYDIIIVIINFVTVFHNNYLYKYLILILHLNQSLK